MTRAEDSSDWAQERFVYFPGCLEGDGAAADAAAGITVFERARRASSLFHLPVPVVKDDRPKAFREKAKDDFTGWTVWASSIVAARWAAANAAEFSGRAVLELGSGCGLAGLVVAGVCRPSAVHLTDYNAGTVANLRANVAANCATSDAALADVSGSCFTSRLGALVEVHQMDWDEPETWPAGTEGRPLAFDTVIGADLLYRRSYARKLAVVLDDVLRPGGTFVCATPAQREGLPLLLSLLEQRGYVVEEAEAGPEWRTNPLAPGSLAGAGAGAPDRGGTTPSTAEDAKQLGAAGDAASGAATTDGLFPELYMRSYPLLVLRCVRPLVAAVSCDRVAAGAGAGGAADA